MSFEFVVPALIVLPLAAGAIAFVVRPIAVIVAITVSVTQLWMALLVARALLRSGPIRYEVGGWGAPLGIDLYVDGLSAIMLVMTAGVMLAVSVYATSFFGADPDHDHAGEMFWPLSLFLGAGLNALFLAGDIFNLYVTLEILTLSAVALIGLAGSVDALGAALRYLLVAIVASLFYLLGIVLLYSVYGTLDWQMMASHFASDLPSRCAMVLISVGLLLKTALFPLHFWLPGAHANAPAPASALLSGLVLKASFFVLMRLWFEVFPTIEFHAVGHLLGMLGALAILWGSVQAIYQQQLKLLVAYSTVAQVGYLFLAFSLTAHSETPWIAWSATVYFAMSHAFAKSAAFLAAGSLRYSIGSDDIDRLAGAAQQQPMTVFAFGLAGVALMGLPPSGAFLAKWLLLNSALAAGQWSLAIVILVGGLSAAVYTFRVIAKSFVTTDQQPVRPVPLVMRWIPLALALVSIGLGVFAAPAIDLLEVGAPFSPLTEGGTP